MRGAELKRVGPDPEFDAANLTRWRSTGRTLVANHFAEFQQLTRAAETLAATKCYGEAAAASRELAATYAVLWHTGQFTSVYLDDTIRTIGRSAIPFVTASPIEHKARRRPLVLHVATKVADIGGQVRMMWRWIARDTENMHSVALTRQNQPVPQRLDQAVERAGGRIHQINRTIGGLLIWARKLQTLMQAADIIVLHVDTSDVIPFLALAGMRSPPPVAFLNHSDHIFWVGASFVDFIINTRESGLALSAHRRGIPPERNLLLPLCLEPMHRTKSRKES